MAKGFSKGSQWRKWDLHVHTPESPLQHSLGDDWDAYVEKLIDAAQQRHIKAIATADYFTVEGYKKLQNYYNAGTQTLSVAGKSTNLLIIPGVELRLNIFNSEEESINIHVLFDPGACSSDFITQNFLEELKTTYRNSPYPFKQQNLWAIGKSIADGTALNTGQDFSGVTDAVKKTYIKKALGAVTLGYASIDEALKEISEIFERHKLPAKAHLVAIVGKGHGGISSLKWFEDNKQFSRSGLIREHLTYQADLIFSNDLADRNFYLGKIASTPVSEIEARFNNLKPCIWGSDAHSIPTLLHPSNGNTLDYTWIKADVSFEGLKQITYEPELRVLVQESDPSESEIYVKIDKLEVDFPEDLKIKDKESTEELAFCIQGKQEIWFSSNLTCVIGGRGSGKSSIMQIMYNLVQSRDSNRLSNVNSPLFNLQLGSKDVLGKIRTLTKSEIPTTTEFFLQNEVEKSAKDIGEMSYLVRSRLYGLSAADDSRTGLEELEEKWKIESNKVESLLTAYDDITRIESEIEELKKNKDTLVKQTAVITSQEYKDIQTEVAGIAREITNFETYETEYIKFTSEISSLIKSISRLNWEKYEGQSLLTTFSSELTRQTQEFKTSYEAAKRKYDAESYQTKLNDKRTQLREFLKIKGLSPENIGEVAKATQQIASLEKQLNTLESNKVPHKEVYDDKENIIIGYKEAYKAYKDEFNLVTGKLKDELSNLKFDDDNANILFDLKTNELSLKTAIAEFIKTNNPSKMPLRSDSLRNVLFNNDTIPVAEFIVDKAKIVTTVNDSGVADAHSQILKELVNQPKFLEKIHLRMTRHYFDIENIQVQTKLGVKLLQNTSFGERCGIVIAIALATGTNPIVIDQPEDNLDGKYISRVLVPLIRRQKLRRQIILVTRDANIVIGGDSELVLILDKEQAGTKILPATIENKTIRSKYIWILDGGEVAFKKREEKYSLS